MQSGTGVGSVLGPYRLERLLGRGGFGEVYAATDTAKDRVVALKLISAPYSADPAFRERLFREANTAGRLHEPHVVPIHAYGELEGQLYIDMRLVDGADLATLLTRQGALEPARAVWMVRQIASALDAAHSAGMVHRDVKPANALVTADDFVYLADFGLANAASDTKLTGTGMTIGTMAYMAPERFTHLAQVDHRADVYALACVLFECLTGQPPYSGDTAALMGAHLHKPVPRPSQVRMPVPAAFDTVVARGMAKDPAQRYSSTGELAAAAHRALTEPDQMPAPVGRPAVTAEYQSTLDAVGNRPNSAIAHPNVNRRKRFGRRRWIAASVVPLLVASVVLAFGIKQWTGKTHGQQTGTAAADRGGYGMQIELPFTGSSGSRLIGVGGIAVDGAGNVYINDLSQVLKLAAGNMQTVEVLPKDGIFQRHYSPSDVAVDASGNVYFVGELDYRSNVWKLTGGTGEPATLPFPGLSGYGQKAIAVTDSGDVSVTDDQNPGYRILKLAAGSTEPTERKITPFVRPGGLAVDQAGNTYVADDDKVLKYSADVSKPTELPVGDLKRAEGLALDVAGNLYVSDVDNNRVVKLAAGTNEQTVLPFSGLNEPTAVAVDKAGNVYVVDRTGESGSRVIKLPVG